MVEPEDIDLGVSSADADEIRRQMKRFREAVEGKEWDELRAFLEGRPIWVHDQMTDAQGFLGLMKAFLENTLDVDMRVEGVIESDFQDQEARIGLNVKLVATDADTLEQKSEEHELYMGFEKAGPGRWSISYLGFVRAPDYRNVPTDEGKVDAEAINSDHIPPKYPQHLLQEYIDSEISQGSAGTTEDRDIDPPGDAILPIPLPDPLDDYIESRVVPSQGGMTPVYLPVFVPPNLLGSQ